MKKYEKAHGSFERALDHAKSLGMENFQYILDHDLLHLFVNNIS